MNLRSEKMASRLLAGLSACVLITGCGHNAEVVLDEPQTEILNSASADNGAGSEVSRMKRILLLPVVLEVSPQNPKDCMDVCEPERDRSEIALAVSEHLEWSLGYDVLCLDFACRRSPENPYSNELLSGWAAEMANWSKEFPTERQLPDRLIEIVDQINSTFKVDGLVVIHGGVRYLQYVDVTHWMATLTASMYYNLVRGNTAKLHADVYSIESARRLWSAKTTVTQVGKAQTWPGEEARLRYGHALFAAFDVCAAPDSDQ